MPLILTIVMLLGSYLFGSLNSAILLCKLCGAADPRSQGSQNPGATNVARVAGRRVALATLGLDILKGVLPVGLAQLWAVDPVNLGWIGLAVFLGHCYPVFFGFKGGKGVATGVGVLLALSWPLAVGALATFAAVFGVWRMVSLASVSAAISAPILSVWLGDTRWIVSLSIMAFLVVARHHTNLRRLLKGEETKYF